MLDYTRTYVQSKHEDTRLEAWGIVFMIMRTVGLHLEDRLNDSIVLTLLTMRRILETILPTMWGGTVYIYGKTIGQKTTQKYVKGRGKRWYFWCNLLFLKYSANESSMTIEFISWKPFQKIFNSRACHNVSFYIGTPPEFPGNFSEICPTPPQPYTPPPRTHPRHPTPQISNGFFSKCQKWSKVTS